MGIKHPLQNDSETVKDEGDAKHNSLWATHTQTHMHTLF